MTVTEAIGTSNVHIGNTGSEVSLVQYALRTLGYRILVDGVFGMATFTAVQQHQRLHHLTVDGVVGPITAASLDAAVAANQNHSHPITPVETHIGDDKSLPLWFLYGLTLINVHEGPGGTDNLTILAWAEEEGGSIARYFNHDSIAWCALYANHCLTHVGLPGTETLYALDFRGLWPAIRLSGPAVGAFAPMKRFSQGKLVGGHIIQIAGKDRYGNIMGLGGNQSDEVSIRPFPLARLDQGFWWPKGVSAPIPGELPLVSSNGRISTNEA